MIVVDTNVWKAIIVNVNGGWKNEQKYEKYISPIQEWPEASNIEGV